MGAPKEEFHIRPASEYDFSGLCALYRDLIPDDHPATPAKLSETFSTMLDREGLTIFLGIQGQVPVSTCTLIVVPNMTRGCTPYGMIENVVTLESRRGQGYGEKLLKAVLHHAWEIGCYKVMLLSGTHNSAAHRFYKTLGFQNSKTGFEIRAPGYLPRPI